MGSHPFPLEEGDSKKEGTKEIRKAKATERERERGAYELGVKSSLVGPGGGTDATAEGEGTG